MSLDYRNHRADPAAWAKELGISKEAVDLYLASDVIDLHTCSFMWKRIFPWYDVRKRHRAWLPSSAFFNQVDLPRAREAQLSGISWDMTANPFRTARGRLHWTRKNLDYMLRVLREFPSDYRIARNYAQYEAARKDGCTAALISIQGGTALGDTLDAFGHIPDVVHRMTIVHLTESKIGVPNSQPRKKDKGLTPFGKDVVRRMQERKILVDLSHINRKGFFDAMEAADPSIPVVVTHTGISVVHPVWRNIDDEQIRAIAGRGGTIGIIYHPYYLNGSFLGCPLSCVVDHMEHVVKVAGDDFVSLGSDYDGLILLPTKFHDVTHQPKLVALMLERGWKEDRIKKILGGNFLRVFKAVRP